MSAYMTREFAIQTSLQHSLSVIGRLFLGDISFSTSVFSFRYNTLPIDQACLGTFILAYFLSSFFTISEFYLLHNALKVLFLHKCSRLISDTYLISGQCMPIVILC